MAELQELARPLQESLNKFSAAEAADYLISAYVTKDLLNLATSEPGTAMWVVNRSDVYDLSLQKLFDHPLPEIASRAHAKYSARHGSLNMLSPPEETGPLEEVHEHDIEEVLGHPLAPFEAMVYFSKNAKEDYRASSALSLTRRVLEHPPNWGLNLQLKSLLTETFFRMLLEDPSRFARSYAARVPLLSESHLLEALRREEDDFVVGRILQNPAAGTQSLQSFLEKNADRFDDFPFAFAVCFLDERLEPGFRRSWLQRELSPLHRQILDFQLAAGAKLLA